MHIRSALAASLLAFLASSLARAGVVVYTDRTAWESAVGTWRTETFDGLPNGELAPGLNSAGLVDLIIFGEPRFARLDDTSGPLNPNGSRHFAGTASGLFDEFIGWPGLRFQTPTTAFGADFRSGVGEAGLTLDIAGELVRLADHLAPTGDGFLGFVLPDPIDLVVLGVDAPTTFEAFGLDNVSFQVVAAVPVPEPSAGLLAAIGLTSASVLLRRQSD